MQFVLNTTLVPRSAAHRGGRACFHGHRREPVLRQRREERQSPGLLLHRQLPNHPHHQAEAAHGRGGAELYVWPGTHLCSCSYERFSRGLSCFDGEMLLPGAGRVGSRLRLAARPRPHSLLLLQ